VNSNATQSKATQNGKTYGDGTGILAIEGHDGLSARLKLDLVLRSKSGHDLDTICGRHVERRLCVTQQTLSSAAVLAVVPRERKKVGLDRWLL
jgi:hypothetical protein